MTESERAKVEAVLRAKLAADEAETGLYVLGQDYVAVDRVGPENEVTFLWFDAVIELAGMLPELVQGTSSSLETELAKIDKLSQRQDSTVDQLRALRPFANRLGLYDAADHIRAVVADADRRVHEIERRHAARRAS